MNNSPLNVSILGRITLAAAALMSVHVCARSQAIYPEPEDAATALVDAVSISDDDALKRVLGPGYATLFPQGVDQEDIYAFLTAWTQQREIFTLSDRLALFAVGTDAWTFPIPLLKAKGGWKFDLPAGKAEIQRRAMGRNELTAIDVLFQLEEAQHAYASQAGSRSYARKLVSTPGRTDGLYWPKGDGETESPVGPVALAMTPDTPKEDAFHGYRYRIVPFSKTEYVLEAWPARPGVTGLSAFALLSDRRLFERRTRSGSIQESVLAQLFQGNAPDWKEVTP